MVCSLVVLLHLQKFWIISTESNKWKEQLEEEEEEDEEEVVL